MVGGVGVGSGVGVAIGFLVGVVGGAVGRGASVTGPRVGAAIGDAVGEGTGGGVGGGGEGPLSGTGVLAREAAIFCGAYSSLRSVFVKTAANTPASGSTMMCAWIPASAPSCTPPFVQSYFLKSFKVLSAFAFMELSRRNHPIPTSQFCGGLPCAFLS